MRLIERLDNPTFEPPQCSIIGTALAIGLGVASAAASVGSAALGAHAAGKAADTQSAAALNAAQIQAQSSKEALAEQQRQFNIQQQNIAPFLRTGTNANAELAYLMGVSPQTAQQGTSAPPGAIGTTQDGGQVYPPGYGSGIGPDYQKAPAYGQMRAPEDAGLGEGVQTDQIGGGIQSDPNGVPLAPGAASGTAPDFQPNPALGAAGSLLAPWTEQFQAPTDVTEQNDPGYQFRLAEGMKALQRSAAAKGNLFTGGTGKALTRYGQDYASSEYGNVYNRALGQFQQRYNIDQTNKANTYNRLSAMSGGGQTAAGQLNSASQNYGNNAAQILIGSGNAQAQGINNAAAARASGYVGGANAYGGALQGGTNSILQSVLLGQLLKGGGTSAPNYYPGDSGLYGY
jgi:hypothetical protein